MAAPSHLPWSKHCCFIQKTIFCLLSALVFYCTINCFKFSSLNNQTLSHSCYRSEVQLWLNWVFCSEFHKAEIKVSNRLHSHMELRFLFQAHVIVGSVHCSTVMMAMVVETFQHQKCIDPLILSRKCAISTLLIT